jgi:hypothetical protein
VVRCARAGYNDHVFPATIAVEISVCARHMRPRVLVKGVVARSWGKGGGQIETVGWYHWTGRILQTCNKYAAGSATCPLLSGVADVYCHAF